jgi:dTMP kinase
MGLARAARRGATDRLEQEDLTFHNRVRWAYLRLAAANPSRYLVVDATLPVDAIHHLVNAYVFQLTADKKAAA